MAPPEQVVLMGKLPQFRVDLFEALQRNLPLHETIVCIHSVILTRLCFISLIVHNRQFATLIGPKSQKETLQDLLVLASTSHTRLHNQEGQWCPSMLSDSRQAELGSWRAEAHIGVELAHEAGELVVLEVFR